uniref:Uncharacterized protein n=1 Tax=Arundo donax TaxID=35708 RepID=A0A0A9BBP8_ARUDO
MPHARAMQTKLSASCCASNNSPHLCRTVKHLTAA